MSDKNEEAAQKNHLIAPIDFSRYQTDELMLSISSLLQFPKYAFMAFMVPTVILLFLFGLVSGLLFYFHFGSIAALFLVFGLISTAITAAIVGVVYLSKRIMTDLQVLFGASLELTEQITEDCKTSETATPAESPQPMFPKIVEDTNHLAFIPVVSQVIRQRMPLVGGLIVWLVQKGFKLIERQILEAADFNNRTAHLPAEQQRTLYYQSIHQAIQNLQSKLVSAVPVAYRMLIRPMEWGMVLAIVSNLIALISAMIALFMYGI